MLLQGFTLEQKALAAVTLSSCLGMAIGPALLPVLSRWFTRLRRRPLAEAGGVALGSIFIPDEARLRHTHIIGATGSGKSVLIEHLLYRDLARGHGALIIDPKGDRSFYERLHAYCQSIGRAGDLKLLSATHPGLSVRWNPLRLGSASELQSKFYCSSKYEHSFYAKATELALGRAFAKLEGLESLHLGHLVEELEELSNGGRDENLKGLYFDIQNLAQGEWAPILGGAPKAGVMDEVSLLDLTRKNEILFVDLPTEGKSVQSARVGSLLLQEITLLSGIRKRMPGVRSSLPFSVFIDEFDAFATDPFVSFLNKGRSSDFMIHIAHQTLSDLKKVSPTFLGQVMGNPNVFFTFRLNLAEDAEMLAKLFGTQTSNKRTFQTQAGVSTGLGSNREVQEFRIHPDSIKDLKTGECVVSIKTSRLLEVLSVPPPTPGNLPSLELPIHRGTLSLVVEASRKRRSISELSETYADLVMSHHKGDVL